MNNTFILDFETTGLNPYHDEIIEIAIKKYGEEKIYTKLTKPIKINKLPLKIIQITKITDEMLEKESININTGFIEMMNYIIENLDNEGPIYLLAHNGTMFDFILLQQLFKNYSLINELSESLQSIYNRFKYLDTLLLARYIIKDRYTYSQNALAKTYLINQNNAHRAFGDVIVLEQIFNKLIESHSINYQLNIEDYLKIDKIYSELY